MTLVLAIAVGVLFAAGIYSLLMRSLAQLVLGLALMSHGANLAVFVAGGLTRAAPPLVAAGQTNPPTPAADPLPQALVLTAIVISFALTAFAAALMLRARHVLQDDDPDAMRSTDT
jgi:multicomponent Na+:H+ antiporter subunit C